MIPTSAFWDVDCYSLQNIQAVNFQSTWKTLPMLWYLTSVDAHSFGVPFGVLESKLYILRALRPLNFTLAKTKVISISSKRSDMMSKGPRNIGFERCATSKVTMSALLPSCQATRRRAQPSAPQRLDFCSFPRVCDQDSSSIRNQDWR